jgi:hypothetical protein
MYQLIALNNQYFSLWYVKYILEFYRGPVWLNELGSWITFRQLIQAYHQYGVGSRPAL